jgi:hypothetical protein
MASFFSFSAQPVDVEIKLTGESDRRQVEVKGEKDKKEMCPVYYDGEGVSGQVSGMTLPFRDDRPLGLINVKWFADRSSGQCTSQGWKEVST